MATIKVIDPVTRLEGHMKVKIEVSQGEVVDAKVSGTLFRGFENIMKGRSPDDAPLILQRVCGVCPVSHAQASVLAIEAATGYEPLNNARLVRNLVLGSNFIQSHILHFYLLSAVDFVPGPAIPPWTPGWDVDMRPGLAEVSRHLGYAIRAREAAHEMGAIFAGKLPHSATHIPGGMDVEVTPDKVNRFKKRLIALGRFIRDFYIPDVQAVGAAYPDYANIGIGPENLLAYGVFIENDGSKLLKPGYLRKGDSQPSDNFGSEDITEHVTKSWYVDGVPLSPTNGVTEPQHPKTDAYSWLKSPRLFNEPFEVGPLARMKINGDYIGGISTLDRHVARAQETLKIARAMGDWLQELEIGPCYDSSYSQGSGLGIGLTEAPRGALGHWADIGDDGRIANYQIITPTCWNASPGDDLDVQGPIEQALIGTPIQDEDRPIEALRVVHSFDPCLACAVH